MDLSFECIIDLQVEKKHKKLDGNSQTTKEETKQASGISCMRFSRKENWWEVSKGDGICDNKMQEGRGKVHTHIRTSPWFTQGYREAKTKCAEEWKKV